MKKKLLLTLFVILSVCLVLALCACDEITPNPTQGAEHTHTMTAHPEVKATCEADGTGAYWECSDCKKLYSDADGKTEITAIPTIAKLNHAYGAAVYSWSADNKTCTATKTCANDASHKITESAPAAITVVKAQDCGQAELSNVSVTFTNSEFAAQSKTNVQTKPAGAHAFGAPTYKWSGTSTCTATRACSKNSAHVESETVSAKVTYSGATSTFTATFTNPAFATQTKSRTNVTHACSHVWGEVEYTWDTYYTTCTATRLCTKNCGGKESETRLATKNPTQDVSCKYEEISTVTATFNNSAFGTRTEQNVKTAEINPNVHDYDGHRATYSDWNSDHTSITATIECKFNSTHVLEITATKANGMIDYKVTTPGNCVTDEKTTATAKFGNANIPDKVSEPYMTKEATGIHVDMEFKDATAATCTEEATIKHYHCKICGNNYENENGTGDALSTIKEGNPLGHDYKPDTAKGENGYTWANIADPDTVSCTAHVVCDRDNTHTADITITMASSEDGSIANAEQTHSCGATSQDGKYKYTANFTVTDYGAPTNEHIYQPAGHYDTCIHTEPLSFTLNADEKSYKITGYDHTKGTMVVIPSMYDPDGADGPLEALPVTAIDGAKKSEPIVFRDNTNLKEVIFLGTNFTDTGYNAFNGCTGLAKVVLPSSLTKIEQNTFSGCTSLKNVTIPKSLKIINATAFSGCTTTITYEGTCKDWNDPEKITKAENWANEENITYVFEGCTLGDAVYDWNTEDLTNVTCTATRTCPTDSSHKVVEEGEVAKEGAINDCATGGTLTYTATFKDTVNFPETDAVEDKQIKKVVIDGGEHAYALDTSKGVEGYTWSGENGVEACVANVECSKCNKETTIPATNISHKVTQVAACDKKLTTTYTATFEKYEPATKDVYGESDPDKHYDGCTHTNGLNYTKIGEGADAYYQVSSYTLPAGSNITVFIPATHKENGDESALPVKSIGDNWIFSGKTTITEVIFPSDSNITTIGNGAFNGCTGLTELNLPDSVTTIGNSAFNGCKGLTALSLPDSVETIGDQAFYSCDQVTTIKLPNNLQSVGNEAFNNLVNLKTIEFNPLSTSAFKSDNNDNPTCLYNVNTKTAVLAVKDGNVTIPDGVEVIGKALFNRASKAGFANNLTVSIPTSVNKIEAQAFRQVIDGDSTATINFQGTCAQWDAIEKTEDNPDTEAVETWNAQSTALVINVNHNYGAATYKWAENGSKCTATRECQTENCGAKITAEVTAEENEHGKITAVEGEFSCETGANTTYTATFTDTTNFPTSTEQTKIIQTTQPGHDYKDCPHVKNLTYKYVGESSEGKGDAHYIVSGYADNSGDGIAVIPEMHDNGTNGPAPVTALADPTSLTEDDYSTLFTSSVKNTANTTLKEIYFIGNNITSIQHRTFMNCTALKKAVLPTNATLAGSNTFNGCTSLKEVNIPNNTTNLQNYTFNKCSALEKIVIPEGVASIGEAAFYGCSSLKTIKLPANLTTINSTAFQLTPALETIEFEKNSTLDFVSNCVINNSTNTVILAPHTGEVVIPKGVTTLGSNLFYYSTANSDLTVYLPNSIEKFEAAAFRKFNGTINFAGDDDAWTTITVTNSPNWDNNCWNGYTLNKNKPHPSYASTPSAS